MRVPIFCLAILLAAASCAAGPEGRRQLLVLHFPDVEIAVEAAASLEDAVELQGGELRFERRGSSVHYQVAGEGSFEIRGCRFEYRRATVTSECRGFDKKLGAVLIRTDGSLQPLDLLPAIRPS